MTRTITAAVAGTAFILSAGAAGADQSDFAANCASKYGPDDQFGAANLLTPEMAKAAAELVTDGKVYSLGVETNSTTPAFGSRSWAVVINQPGQAGGASLGGTKTTYNDDVHMGYVGIGSQIDGLGHIGIDNLYYNCNRNTDFVQADGLKKLGTEHIPNIVTRGVLLDMTKHFGDDVLDAGTFFNEPEISAAAEAQGVEIREGDVVIFHTGWLSLVGEDDARYLAGEPGLSLGGAEYLASKGVVAIGADTWGLESVPFEEGVGVFEVHQYLLAREGIYILENMVTAELAADETYEFMFVLGHMKATGSVQAIINPTAIR